MLALQYGDGFLELANPVGVVTKWVSTAFNNSDDLLGSGNDLSFDLAETPGNHVRLGFANNLANRLARKDIEVVIWLFGMPWKRCIFTPTAAGETSSTQIATTAFVANAIGGGVVTASGVYIPGLTNQSNVIASAIQGNATYTRVGNNVHISLTVNITPTASGTNTVLYFTLPSGLSVSSGSGSGICVGAAGGPTGVALYQCSTQGKIIFVSNSTTINTYYLQFDYSI